MKREPKPKSQALYILACENCRLSGAFDRSPPDCINFKCTRCGYDEYALYAVNAFRISQLRDEQKLLNFRMKREGCI